MTGSERPSVHIIGSRQNLVKAVGADPGGLEMGPGQNTRLVSSPILPVARFSQFWGEMDRAPSSLHVPKISACRSQWRNEGSRVGLGATNCAY